MGVKTSMLFGLWISLTLIAKKNWVTASEYCGSSYCTHTCCSYDSGECCTNDSGNDYSSSYSMSAGWYVLIVAAIIVKIAFWICCCYFIRRRRQVIIVQQPSQQPQTTVMVNNTNPDHSGYDQGRQPAFQQMGRVAPPPYSSQPIGDPKAAAH